jgi:homoserine O-acetyltransferase
VARLALLAPLSCARPSSGAQLADLGDLRTEGGAVLSACRVSYRTWGQLDADGANAVLLLPWFLGTSAELAPEVGARGLVNDPGAFVVAVDPLGNGVSCSPSNSAAQPGARFPRISIGDMVESQHALLTRILGVRRLRAVVGVSMGGLQALAWGTRHPEMVDAVVAVAASPRTPAADRARWTTAIAEVHAASRWGRAGGALWRLAPREAARQLGIDAWNHQRQAEAIADLDLTAPFDGSLARTAAVLPRTLLVVSARDEVIDPAPARALAALGGATLVELDGRCGHRAPSCERPALLRAVRGFLSRPSRSAPGSAAGAAP